MSFIYGNYKDKVIPDREILSKERVDINIRRTFNREELACECVYCHRLFDLNPCSNCGGNHLCKTSTNTKNMTGIFCDQCGYGQTEWRCSKCATDNLMWKSLVHIRRRSTSTPVSVDDYYEQALLFEETEKLDAAIRVAREGFQKYDHSRLRELLIRLLIKGKQTDAAIKLYNEELLKHPEDKLLRLDFGKLLVSSERYNQVVALSVQYVEDGDLRQALVKQLLNKDCISVAVQLLQEYLKLKPNDTAARRQVAGLLRQQGDLDAAIGVLRYGLSINSTDPKSAEDNYYAEFVLESLSYADIAVRKSAVGYYINGDDPDKARQLEKHFTVEKDSGVQIAILDGLAKLQGASSASFLLEKGLAASSSQVREQAAYLLKRVGRASSVSRLIEKLTDEKDKAVQEAILDVVDKFSPFKQFWLSEGQKFDRAGLIMIWLLVGVVALSWFYIPELSTTHILGLEINHRFDFSVGLFGFLGGIWAGLAANLKEVFKAIGKYFSSFVGDFFERGNDKPGCLFATLGIVVIPVILVFGPLWLLLKNKFAKAWILLVGITFGVAAYWLGQVNDGLSLIVLASAPTALLISTATGDAPDKRYHPNYGVFGVFVILVMIGVGLALYFLPLTLPSLSMWPWWR